MVKQNFAISPLTHMLDLDTKLRFVLMNYVESPDGFFAFPDGDTWPCKQKDKHDNVAEVHQRQAG